MLGKRKSQIDTQNKSISPIKEIRGKHFRRKEEYTGYMDRIIFTLN